MKSATFDDGLESMKIATFDERFTRTIASPIGPLVLVATHDALAEIGLPSSARATSERVARVGQVASHRVLDRVERELDEYFRGARTTFSVPLCQQGTPFQLAVWQALVTIPYGQSRSYTWIAERVESPRATRAVGSANGRNRLPIIIPCHRVIAADGGIGGYAGGLAMKRWLLEHERILRTAKAHPIEV